MRPIATLSFAIVVLLALVVALLAVASGPGAVHEPVTLAGASTPEPREVVRIATWNVHYGAGAPARVGRSGSREETDRNLAAVAQVIDALDIDVLALQEVDRPSWRSHGIDQLTWLRETTGLDHVAYADLVRARWVPWPLHLPSRQLGQLHSGIAVLSRYPLHDATRLRQPDQDLPWPAGWFGYDRSALQVDVALGARRLTVVNVHAEPFDAPTRRAQVEALALAVQGLDDLVVLGDFNVGPEGLTALTGGPLRSALPDDRAPTFPSEGLRLDDILVSSTLEVRDAEIVALPASPSDHLPVVATVSVDAP